MKWSDIPFDPPLKTLRQFGGIWLVFFGGWGVYQGLMRGHATAGLILVVAALAVGLLGLIRPAAVRLIYVGWMVLAFPIGWTVSFLILTMVFFGLFAPIGLIFRLIGRDALARTRRPDAPTYWMPKPAPTNLRSYFHQF
jgi:Saxitoxin biosynthesis operon protein SxtJ